MTSNQVNEVIAKYMGYELRDDYVFKEHELGINQEELYTESLDALVPVIEKLDMYHDNYFGKSKSGEDSYCFELVHSQGRHYRCTGKTIQEAAAHATAKCIVSLNIT